MAEDDSGSTDADKPNYKYEIALKETRWARRLVQKYKKFHFINPEHITCVIDKKADTSKKYARISLIPPKVEPLLGIGLIIEIWDCNWSDLPKSVKRLILFHELEHVVENDRLGDYDKPYRTKEHDVQEFGPFIEAFGLHWTHRDDLPDPIKQRVKIARGRTGMPTLG